MKAYKQRVYREKKEEEKAIGGSIIEAAEKEGGSIIEAAQKEASQIVNAAKDEAHAILANSTLTIVEREKLVLERERMLAHQEKAVNAAMDELSGRGPIPVPDLFQIRASRKQKAATSSRLYYARTKRAREIGVAASSSSTPNRSLPSIHRVSQGLVRHLEETTCKFNVSARKEVVLNFLKHPRMSLLQPEPLAKPKVFAALKAGMADMKNSVQKVKEGKRTEHRIAKSILSMAFAGKTVVDGRFKSSLSHVLGVKTAVLVKGATARKLWDGETVSLQSLWERKSRCDKVSPDVEKVIKEFWENHTRVSPNMKDSKRRRVDVKVYIEHRIHWLEDSQVSGFILPGNVSQLFHFEWLNVFIENFPNGMVWFTCRLNLCGGNVWTGGILFAISRMGEAAQQSTPGKTGSYSGIEDF